MFTLTSISALIFLATMVNTFTAYVAWQRRKTRGGIYFALAMIALALWSMASGLDYAATSVPLKIFFAKLEYATYFPALSLMTAFSITYAGRSCSSFPSWVSCWHGLMNCIHGYGQISSPAARESMLLISSTAPHFSGCLSAVIFW